MKHGFFGIFRVLPGEDQELYNEMLEELLRDQKPVGALETDLVRQMAQHLWLKRRAARYQEVCFITNQPPELKAKNQMEVDILADLERFTLIEAHQDRLFHRALNALLKLRKEREKSEIGFVRRKREEAEETRRAELHPFKVATAKARAEQAQSNAIAAGIRAATQMERFGGPDFVKNFAQMAA
ncbi:MAG TPA: hypothetical protein VKV05_02120 [Terriglobales bacterium]|nr:hypothetical protein [Terriglobales bacterium]